MSTELQDVLTAKAKIADLKEEYMLALNAYIQAQGHPEEDRVYALLQCQQKGNNYFNYIEEFVGNSSSLGAHEDALWGQGFAEDCAEILGSMPAHFSFLKVGFENSKTLKNVQYLPGSTAYANMQRMAKRYLARPQIDALIEQFIAASLPVYGFKNKAKSFMQRDKILAYVFGVTFVIILLCIAWLKPDPSKFQYGVFRTVLALAAAGIGAVIPGTLIVKASKWIRAGGAIALFVLVYFWLPA